MNKRGTIGNADYLHNHTTTKTVVLLRENVLNMAHLTRTRNGNVSLIYTSKQPDPLCHPFAAVLTQTGTSSYRIVREGEASHAQKGAPQKVGYKVCKGSER